jgi:hypothetical protein
VATRMKIISTTLTAVLAVTTMFVSMAMATPGFTAEPTIAVGQNAVRSTDVSIQDLITRLQQSEALRARYARHLRVAQEQVVTVLQKEIVLSRLSEAQTLTTFCQNRSGVIYPVDTHLPKGSAVWVTRTGVLVCIATGADGAAAPVATRGVVRTRVCVEAVGEALVETGTSVTGSSEIPAVAHP